MRTPFRQINSNTVLSAKLEIGGIQRKDEILTGLLKGMRPMTLPSQTSPCQSEIPGTHESAA